MGNKKGKKAKELAKQRKLEKERAKAKGKMEARPLYKIGYGLINATMYVLKGIVALILTLFSIGSKMFNILMVALLLFLLLHVFYSVAQGDAAGAIVSIIAIMLLSSVLILMRRSRE